MTTETIPCRTNRRPLIIAEHARRTSGMTKLSAGASLGVESRMDPLLRPVGPDFLLPDRNDLLEGVDQPAAGLEGLVAMRAAHGDRDTDLAQVEVADAMHHHQFDDRPAPASFRLRARPAFSGPSRGRPRRTRRTVRRSPVSSRTVPRNVQTAPASGERTRSVTAAGSIGEVVISIMARNGLRASRVRDDRESGPTCPAADRWDHCNRGAGNG